MKIHALAIRNFLSFDDFEWADIPTELNVVVGPNGSGKTNLLMAFRAVVDSFQYDQRSSMLRELPHSGMQGLPATISLDVSFDDSWEQEVLCAFVAAATTDDQSVMTTFNNQPRTAAFMEKLSRWVDAQCIPERLSWLFKGRLVVQFDGRDYVWMYYHSLTDDPFFFLDIAGPGGQSRLAGSPEVHNNPAAGQNSPIASWLKSLSEDARSQWTSYFEETLPNEPAAFDLLQISSLAEQRLGLQVMRPSSAQMVSHRRFSHVLNLSLEQSRIYNAQFVFGHLLQHGFVVSENVHEFPTEVVSDDDLTREAPLDISSGRNLGLYLFRKKNGDAEDRDEFRRIQHTFGYITFGCSFDVRLIATNDQAEQVAPAVRIVTSNLRGDEVLLRYSGAGRWEALFFSTLIESAEDRVALLDEPATNIHTPVQRRILRRMQLSKTQFFLVTHAPTLIPTDSLENLSRFYLHNGASRRASLGSLDPETRGQLQKELRESGEARAMLMSRRVILTEGGTELGALGVWFDELEPEAPDEYERQHEIASADLSLFDVGGDTAFEKFVMCLEHFHVPWAIVCDGPVIGPLPPRPASQEVEHQLRKAGIKLPFESLAAFTFQDRCQALKAVGVFTVAKSARQEFEHAIPELAAFVRGRRKQKPRLGYEFAISRKCPKEVVQLRKEIAAYFDRVGA